ncbi:hypothetical protein NDA13_006058 [Ustilago tritici]|nr:hypothetical protein NDA13_006058 [Ustilago tritici]
MSLTISARKDTHAQCQANFAFNYPEYKARCEGGNDSNHTCFTHWAGELKGAEACLYVSSSDVKMRLMIKDDHMKGIY